VGHHISLKELIPLLLDCRGLLIVLVQPLQLLHGHLLGFISVPTGLCLASLKVDHLCVQVVLGLLILKKELGLCPAALHEGLQERSGLEIPKRKTETKSINISYLASRGRAIQCAQCIGKQLRNVSQ
jgi:hypothetical protein